MDFTPTPGQTDAAELARQILGDRCTPEHLAAVEHEGERFDEALWRQLGESGLLGLALPEVDGGAGLGLLELTSLLEEAGAVVAPLPLAPHVVSAMAIARFGTEEQRATWLPDAVSGGSVLTTGIAEDHAAFPEHPVTAALREGEQWTLTGAKTTVTAGTRAQLLLVPAATEGGVEVFLVQPDDPGVTVSPQMVSGSERVARLELDGVRLADDRRLGGADAHQWLTEHLAVALSALQLGVCAGALRLTASYAGTREQFGRPIGTFQAVSQRLADCYIDVQGLRLTVTAAAWRLAEGLPAGVEVASAKLWAADTGHKVAHTTVHVHGGVGIDLEGAAHRYFTAAKRIELALGGTTLQAREVGRVLAAEPV
jgi:alkylation response protein AidB-like acyl-CoA dehydrogenase